jgi:hypothetical protein
VEDRINEVALHIDDIEVILERLDGHGDAIADSIHPQSVMNRLFD